MNKITKTIEEIINLLNEDCIIVQSLDKKFWVEKQCEVIKKLTCITFQKLKDLKIITPSNGNAYCRFEFTLNCEFKST